MLRMRAVIQRVSSATVSVDGSIVGEIGPGLLVFLGVGREDGEADADWLVARIVKLRVFERDAGRMDASLDDSEALGRPVPTGVFGEHMDIDAHNDGPVTLAVDTKDREF